jgi:hypothetical protein
MKCATNSLDKEVTMTFLKHGVFISSKVPCMSREEAVILLAEAMVDSLANDFKAMVKELKPGLELSDFVATPYEIQAWLANERNTTLSYSSDCKEVDEKMKVDMQSKLDEYMRLLKQIKQKTQDERTAVALLQEVSKDRRSAEIREERGIEQSQPATDKQKNFMKKLGIKFPDSVTKQEASTLIDEELGKNGE